MQLKIDNFHGIRPRVHPSLLGDGMAVCAHNCRLKSGKLVPLRQPSMIQGAKVHLENKLDRSANAKSLYCWKHTQLNGDVVIDFLAFPGMVDFAEGSIADDPYDRIFVTGETGVPFTDADGKAWNNSPAVYRYSREQNSISRQTICKATPAAPEVAANAAADATKTLYYAFFFVSWVDAYGIESGISQASNTIASVTGGDPNGTGAVVLNSGSSAHFSPMTLPKEAEKVRIYVTSAGTSEASDGIQFCKELPVSAARQASGFNIVFLPDNLGEAEPGIESPPGDLSGMTFVAGGFYAGFSKSSPHTVMFSDIGIVTSWPNAYRYDIKDNIVALATTSNSVFALTDGWPWVLSGTAPESMTVAKLAGPAACVSPRGVCVYRNSVYYASNEGLMAIVNDANAGTVCVNVTQKIFTKEQWQGMNPASCLMAQHDGALFLFFRDADGAVLPCVRIDLNESAEDSVTTNDECATCVCRNNMTDEMDFVRIPPTKIRVTLRTSYPTYTEVRFSTVRYLGKYALPNVQRDGCVFLGWWTTESVGGEQVKSGDICMTKTPHTLYSRWIVSDNNAQEG